MKFAANVVCRNFLKRSVPRFLPASKEKRLMKFAADMVCKNFLTRSASRFFDCLVVQPALV